VCVCTVGYTMDVMYFAWLPNPIEVDKAIQLPQFRLRDTVLYDCSQNYTGGQSICSLSLFLSLSLSLSLSRRFCSAVFIMLYLQTHIRSPLDVPPPKKNNSRSVSLRLPKPLFHRIYGDYVGKLTSRRFDWQRIGLSANRPLRCLHVYCDMYVLNSPTSLWPIYISSSFLSFVYI